MDLRTGEQVIFQGHPSWRAILTFYGKGLGVAVIAGAIVALVTAIGGGVSTAAIVVTVLAVFVVAVLAGFVVRVATTYSITNQRLHIKRGIIARKIQQTRIERVQNVNISQSVLERMLQVGKVDFDTAGTDDSDFTFAGVAHPDKVMEAVEQAQHDAIGAGDTTGLGESVPPQQQPPSPPATQPPPPAAPPPGPAA